MYIIVDATPISQNVNLIQRMGNLINKGKGKGEAKENQEAVKTNLGNRGERRII